MFVQSYTCCTHILIIILLLFLLFYFNLYSTIFFCSVYFISIFRVIYFSSLFLENRVKYFLFRGGLNLCQDDLETLRIAADMEGKVINNVLEQFDFIFIFLLFCFVFFYNVVHCLCIILFFSSLVLVFYSIDYQCLLLSVIFIFFYLLYCIIPSVLPHIRIINI